MHEELCQNCDGPIHDDQEFIIVGVAGEELLKIHLEEEDCEEHDD